MRTLPPRSRRAARSLRIAFERAHAAFVARAPRLDALADPHFLLRQQLVEQRVLLRLGVAAAPRGGAGSCRSRRASW